MLFQNVLARVAVKDLNLAIKWYEFLGCSQSLQIREES